MGFIVLQEVTLDSGLQVSGLYYCIASNCIYTCRVDEGTLSERTYKYRYHCNFSVFASKQSREEGKKQLEEICVIVYEDKPLLNPYETMYENFKARFQNVVDE